MFTDRLSKDDILALAEKAKERDEDPSAPGKYAQSTLIIGGEARKRKQLLSSYNSVTINCRWPVYRRDGMWYLLSAGFPAGAKVRPD